MIDIDDIIKNNKNLLFKHMLKKERTDKNQVFVTYNDVSEFAQDNENFNFFEDIEVINNLKNGEKKLFKEDSKINKNKITKNYIKGFLKGELSYNEKSNSVEIIERKSLKNKSSNILNEDYEKKQSSYKEVVQKNEKIVDAYVKNSSSTNKILNDETLLLLTKVYGWLYDSLETFSSVYEEYPILFEKIADFKVFTTTKKAPAINVRNFLYRYRQTDLLGQKISLIAISLGSYNFHLVDRLKNTTSFISCTKNDFLSFITRNYNGTSFDLSYLKEFEKIVDGDLSGDFIFKDLNTSDELKNTRAILQEVLKNKGSNPKK